MSIPSSASTRSFAAQKLLRSCAIFNPPAEKIARIRSLARSADWQEVIRLGERHAVIPLIYRNLCRHCEGLVPQAVLSQLGAMYVANAARNLHLTAELLRVTAMLEKSHIPVVPFKGPVLAETLFGDVALRQFADVDILVPLNHIETARRLLIADGYEPEFVLPEDREIEYLRSEHAFQFRKKGSGLVVELHWSFGSRNQVFPVNAAEVLGRLKQRRFQGRLIRTLAVEDLLLYLCLHGAKHGWDRLEWISCVAALVRSSEFDWTALQATARRTGGLRALYLGLLLALQLVEFEMPAAVLKAIMADKKARRLADQVYRELFRDEQEHSRREIYRHSFYLRTRERLIDRFRIILYCSVRIPHPLAHDWSYFRIPASLSFLYFLLRPLRLMREYGVHRLRTMLRPGTSF